MMFTWVGDAMVPKHPRLADRHYVIGEAYYLEIREDRSAASHRFYFASINEAHGSLPEDLAERLPTPEHLRKFALIRTGYADQRTHVCASKAEALRLASFIRPMDEFAVVVTHEKVVTVWTAKSQSMRAMDKKTFAESKEKVLDFIASLIGVTPSALDEAGRAA